MKESLEKIYLAEEKAKKIIDDTKLKSKNIIIELEKNLSDNFKLTLENKEKELQKELNLKRNNLINEQNIEYEKRKLELESLKEKAKENASEISKKIIDRFIR